MSEESRKWKAQRRKRVLTSDPPRRKPPPTVRESAQALAVKSLGFPCATPEHGIYEKQIRRGECPKCAAEILNAWRDEVERECVNLLFQLEWSAAALQVSQEHSRRRAEEGR